MVAVLAVTTLSLAPAEGATSTPRAGTIPAPRCSAGLVALTFDDGPAVGTTPRLLRILKSTRTDATFFMVGQRVRSAPEEARLVARSGFVVANHTWSHPRLTSLSNGAIAGQLSSTRDELRRHGIRPSNLMRPPYGLIDDRVRRVVQSAGLRPVLWTIDSRDWEPSTAGQIAARILRGLRWRGTNIVLQHDGVRRSPTSVDAVPIVVREAKRRGYCFTVLGPDGRPKIPVPIVRTTVTPGDERGPRPVVVTLTLDRPTTRAVSLRLRTEDRTARAGHDYRRREELVRFEAGQLRRTVRIPVLDDPWREHEEGFRVLLERPWGMRIDTPDGRVGSYSARIRTDE